MKRKGYVEMIGCDYLPRASVRCNFTSSTHCHLEDVWLEKDRIEIFLVELIFIAYRYLNCTSCSID